MVHRIFARRAALDEIGQRLAGRAGDVDAASAQVRDHARTRLRGEHARRPLAARLPAAARTLGELRHLEDFERLAQLREIDARARLQLAHRALGQRMEPCGQRAAAQLRARAPARHGVGRARREQGPHPFAVLRPAADARRRNAGARGDLRVGHQRGLDQVAHRRNLAVGVRPARAARARHVERVAGGGLGGGAQRGAEGGDAIAVHG